MATQEQIDHINSLVQQYHDGDNTCMDALLEEFDAYLNKQTTALFKYYAGVHVWEHVKQEACVIFYNLVNEYTIGGDAYFTVYIQRKLPLRLRYFFTKEIKRRDKVLSHSDEQFLDKNLLGIADDHVDTIVNDDVDKARLCDIVDVISGDILNEREKDMLSKRYIDNMSFTDISIEYGISRSRTSKIIRNAILKIQENVRYQ